MRYAAITIMLGACTLAGCATRPSEPPPPRVEPRPGPPLPAPTAAPSPRAYVESAASADLFVVRASELALQRLGPGNVRRLAETLVRDHQGMSAQLSLSGRRINLLPPAALQPRHQARLAALQASGSFAGEYRRQMRAVHEELLRLHLSFAANGSSPTLRPVAAAAATTVRRHLAEMR